ncbi:hypothetical protein LTR64_008597 [Lithohypha guttulata]|uniref:uncharacterized protein n=1 Tax=Lithohypha guttulata TaxID=1690604 RepID=UPI00315D226D
MPNLDSIARSTMSSPPTTYSGPPPPYSSAISINGSTQGIPGYMSPPDAVSKRSTRDEKESPSGMPSLPSILEALKSADMAPPAQPFSSVNQHSASVVPPQSFTDAPQGPGNPFSQPTIPASALKSSFPLTADPSQIKAVPPPPAPPDVRHPPSLNPLSSPQLNESHQKLSGLASAAVAPQSDSAPPRASFSADSTRPGYPFPDYYGPQGPTTPRISSNFQFEHHNKFDDSRNPFVKPVSYNETIKRHLDIWDAELALNEIRDSSAQTLEFANVWSQRYHQANRTSYVNDGIPGTSEVDEMMRSAQHIMDNLSRLRDAAVMQENAVNEQRARAARGQHPDEEYHHLSEDFKTNGFAGGDAKKRRGKAAPPGRCHSCNRAETPEWRRGPDGARTLCNACGLHYAKLTRKMGANKAAVLTGSNLRPKSLNDTRP